MNVLIGLLVFATAYGLTTALHRLAVWVPILDRPNSRSLHRRVIPRTGGLAMLIAGLAGGCLTGFLLPGSGANLVSLLFGLAPLGVVAVIDDWHGIRFQWRLLAHVGVAAGLAWAGYVPNPLELPGFDWLLPEWIAVFFALAITVWMINLYNFMDGMDGFAGGMAVIGFATLAWLGRADESFASVCLIVAAASAGFLVHNFPPAKIFMGDTGSTALGFLAAACSLWGSKSGLFPLWVAILVFSPFIADATVTLLRRLLRGEKVWEAHRTHHYQRLVLLGWGHRRAVLAEYALMLACAGSAVLAVHLSPAGQAVLAVGWLVVYGLLMRAVGWLERRRATVFAP